MKKIVAMMIVMLVGMTSLQSKGKDADYFIVEGSFLVSKNVYYTVYQQNSEGTFVSVEHTKAHKSYHIKCDAGYKYMVRFQNKKGDVKFLLIDASTTGYFRADVDWSKPYDGLIKKYKIGYCLTALTNGARPALLAQN